MQNTSRGLYCEAGDFFIDPWQPVDFAILTHAHSDHARPGSRHCLVAETGANLFRERLGNSSTLETLPFGKQIVRNGVTISLHPAGHILGSAQVRLEDRGEVWVVAGDYKLEHDGICESFEPVRCHTFVTESTFGLPIYRWEPQERIFAEIDAWWRHNRSMGRTSVLFGYALGKAQRLLASLDPTNGPIFVHGKLARFLPAYESAGVRFPPVQPIDLAVKSRGQAMVLAPPSADNTSWLKRFGDCSTAFASGWMKVRGTRRRRSMDRGFVLSDHADWPGLISAIRATGASKIWVTHGYTASVVRWLSENGWSATAIETRFGNESEENVEEPAGQDIVDQPNARHE